RRNLALAYGGGFYTTSPPSAKLLAYSVSENKWTRLADAPVAATAPEFAYDSLHDVFLAVVGQQTLIYNPRTNTWAQLPTLLNRGTNMERQNVTYNATQDVFVFQGGTWDKAVWSLLRYSDTGSSSTTPPPPPSPTNLLIGAVSPSGVNLLWTASPSGTVLGYRVYRNGTQIATVTATSTGYSDTSLAPSTTYTYNVSAYDATGNASLPTAPLTVTTAAASTPP